jgi:hypothetical protein
MVPQLPSADNEVLGITGGLESLRRSIPRQNVSLERKVVIDGWPNDESMRRNFNCR